MSLTQRIAAVLGPTLVYLNGLLFFVGGLVIATSHNLWRPLPALLVTLSGWLLIFAGAYRMFLPTAPQLGPGPIAYSVIALLGALGLALSVVGFFKG